LNFDLEEVVEDALCAYLRVGMSGEARVYPSLTAMDGIQFPYVGIEAAESSNVSDEGPFTGRRRVTVMIVLALEAIPVSGGPVIEALRDRNRKLRAQLWGLLARSDLHTDINAALGWTQNPTTKLWAGGAVPVLFSMIMPTDSARSVENRQVTTSITLETIAQPTE
jgi:hypothetical protein